MVRRRIARVTNDRLRLLGSDDALPAVPVGSADWFAWLEEPGHQSFSYAGPSGTFTARRESRHGRSYWYAYRTRDGELRKEYLGLTEALTPERLTGAAANLADPLVTGATLTAEPGSVVETSRSAAASSAPGVPHVLATKLFVPRPRPDLVARPRLLASLDSGLESSRCTLLSAQAGAGKTTLLAAWLAAAPCPVAWLALDERDQDVHQFLRYLIAAFQTVAPSLGQAALAWLDAPPPPPLPEVVITDLVNDLAALPGQCLLVLDDYHLVHAPAIHQAVAFLVDHLPPAVHLVVATREDPPLPLPRLRARGQLTEIRAADLGFTPEEALRFLVDGMGLPLTDEQVGKLVDRTEGWAVGLQLAGLALRDRADPAAFVAAFAGGHRLIADYLATDVLDLQPPATRRFLLATSLLDRLCAPLCDALLAPDAEGDGGPPVTEGDSQETLEALERANLFLLPLDDERRWYRYHQLFADALRARLVREVGAGAVTALHRRASAWFERAGLLPEAIQHALPAGAFDDAANCVELLMSTRFAQGSAFHDIERWLSELPEAVVRARPELCLGRVWLFLAHFKEAPAAEWADAVERALAAVADPARARRLRGSIAAARALIASVGPHASSELARRFAEQAMADLPPDDLAFVVACLSLGAAALAQGRPREAVRWLDEGERAGRAGGQVFTALVAAGQQVSILSILGERRQALATGQAALAWAADLHQPAPRGIGALSAAVADLLRDGDELTAALALATDSVRALRAYENEPALLVVATISLARAHLALGDANAAAAVLAEIRPLLQSGQLAGLRLLIEAVEARVYLALGDLTAANSWAVAAPGIESIGKLLPFRAPAFAAGVQTLGCAVAQILAAHSRATGDTSGLERAERSLDAAWELATCQDLGWLRLQVLIQRAMILDCRGDRDAALAGLRTAVAAAAPEGYIRPFVDEGAPMAVLLEAARVEARKRHPRSDHSSVALVDTLLAVFAGQPPAPMPVADVPRRPARTAPLVEPLSPRELDVLKLLAAGRSNAELARDLVVVEGTIKSHLIHIYGKLGVHTRTQAVARARQLGLLD